MRICPPEADPLYQFKLDQLFNIQIVSLDRHLLIGLFKVFAEVEFNDIVGLFPIRAGGFTRFTEPDGAISMRSQNFH